MFAVGGHSVVEPGQEFCSELSPEAITSPQFTEEDGLIGHHLGGHLVRHAGGAMTIDRRPSPVDIADLSMLQHVEQKVPANIVSMPNLSAPRLNLGRNRLNLVEDPQQIPTPDHADLVFRVPAAD